MARLHYAGNQTTPNLSSLSKKKIKYLFFLLYFQCISTGRLIVITQVFQANGGYILTHASIITRAVVRKGSGKGRKGDTYDFHSHTIEGKVFGHLQLQEKGKSYI